MLRWIIRPFFKFMNRLNYSSKFLVMIMLFAIPLGILATQQINNAFNNFEEARIQRQGIEALQHSHQLIQQLEEWRDLSALRFLSSDPELANLRTLSVNNTREAIESLMRTPAFSLDVSSVGFLQRIYRNIEKPIVAPGMEGINLEIIYDNVQVYINDAYDWQRILANRFGLLGVRDTNLYLLINDLLNDNNSLFLAQGMTRTFGTYYLFNQFIDSSGVYILEKTYTSLEKEKEKLAAKLPQLVTLLNQTNNAPVAYKIPLENVLFMLNEHLIQASELTYHWQQYYQEISSEIANGKAFEMLLLKHARNELLHLENRKRTELTQFIVLAIIIIVLILLLYTGFFYSVRNTIKQLAAAAEAVAAGDLDRRMKTNTNDELSVLAKSLDNMREQLKVRQTRLHELSITDGLTQLKNRSYFDEVMEAETNKATRGNYPVALIIIDIDHFKRVNDTYGHLAGDECLRHVATILRAHVKRTSDVIARYGGEEFAVVLPDTECDEALLLAEEIRKAVATSPVSFARQVISLTLSCGIASTIPKSRRSVVELISHADEALYRAKENGRNRCLINHQESLT